MHMADMETQTGYNIILFTFLLKCYNIEYPVWKSINSTCK